MKKLLIILLLASGQLFAQGPNTTAGNVVLPSYVTLGIIRTVPNEYVDSSSKTYPLILFSHGAGESGSNLANIYNSSGAGGPAYFNAHSGWPDSVINPRNGGEYKFIVCSPQSGSWSPSVGVMQDVITYMVANYRVDTTRIYWVSLSAGGGAQVEYMNGTATVPRYKIAAMVTNAGVVGSYNYANGTKIVNDHTHWLGIGDTTAGATDDPYGVFTASWWKAIKDNGGDTLTEFINHDQGHSRFNYYMDPTRDIVGSMNMYEWLIQYQAYAQASPPIVSAGGNQSIILPTSTATLSGSATADGGGSIVTYSWTKLSGASVGTSGASTATLSVTGLALGTYVFELTATDGNGLSSTSQATLYVQYDPSTNEINVSTRYMIDRDGRNGKGLRGLFDGNLLTNYNISGMGESVGGPVFKSMLILPYKASRIKIEHYDAYDNGTIGVTLFDKNKDSIGAYTITHGSGWETTNMSAEDSVLYIQFSFDNVGAGFYEMKVYGDSVGPSPPIFRAETILPILDPGIFAQGVCQLDNGFLAHLQDGTLIFPKTAKSGRAGYEGARFQEFPEGWSMNLGPASYRRFGDDHVTTRLFDFGDAWDIEMQFYSTGGTIKNIDSTYLTTLSDPAVNNAYLADPWNNYKWIAPGADSLDFNSWAAKGHEVAHHAYRYGNKLGLPLNGLDFRINNADNLGDKSSGQRYGKRPMIYENGNENNRDWAGTRAWHSPAVWYRLQKVSYDSAKSRDPDFKVYMGANTFLDTTYAKAVWFEHFWLNDTMPFPADGFCYNMYQNEFLDGQGGGPSAKAVSPETFKYYDRQVHMKELFSKLFPNKAVRITETGVAYWDDSPYDVDAIGSRTDYQVAADVQLRIFAISQMVPFFERIFYYAGFPDGSVNFSSMTTTIGLYPRLYDSVTCMGYVLANQMAVEEPYNWFSTTILKSDTTGAWVTMKQHATNPNKKLFKVWRGSMTGTTTEDLDVNIGAGAVSAKLYNVNYGSFEPDETTATIVGNTVTMDAKETMQWLEVTYSSDTPPNVLEIGRGEKVKPVPLQ